MGMTDIGLRPKCLASMEVCQNARLPRGWTQAGSVKESKTVDAPRTAVSAQRTSTCLTVLHGALNDRFGEAAPRRW